MKLSVIIVNYNVKAFLEQALLSAQKAAQKVPTEIFVVDNDSVDGSVEMVREKFPDVKLIANKKNVGFSAANNQAILESKGDYVLLLNPDTVVEESTFEKVVAFMDTHPDAGGLGVRMIDGKGKFLPESKRGLPTPAVAFYKMCGLSKLFPKSKAFGRYHLKYLSEHETNEVDVLAGAFMLIRKETLDKIGLLDETFFMYGEDIDLSYRITQAGYKNYYFADTTIIHYKGESTKKTSVNYVFVFYRAMVIFAQKHYKGGNAQLFSLFINVAIWFRAALALCWRFWQRSKYAIVDAVVLFAGHYYAKEYWENNHRYVLGGEYPQVYLWLNGTLYVLLFLLGIYISGGYNRKHTLKNVLQGLFWGTIMISVVYAFLPDYLRFSRALIILDALWGAVFLCVWRLVLHFVKFRNLNYGQQFAFNTIIAGEEEEALRVYGLLKQTDAPHTFKGFVSVNGPFKDSSRYLGNMNHLKEICEVFDVTEVIFCARDIPAETIMGWMSRMDNEQVNFKIVPRSSFYIIGSNSKNTNGELYTVDIKLNIADPALAANKRVFDSIAALILIALFPLLGWFIKKPARAFMGLLNVIIGKLSLVGYAPAENINSLPAIKRGLLSPLNALHGSNPNFITPEKMNFFYAKDYTVGNDLNIVVKGWRNLNF